MRELIELKVNVMECEWEQRVIDGKSDIMANPCLVDVNGKTVVNSVI